MMKIVVIKPEQTHLLRQKILRSNQPLEAMVYSHDTDQTTIHLGAFPEGFSIDSDNPLGILSLYRESFPQQFERVATPAASQEWRLRGMAVDEKFQGVGLGRRLIQTGIQQLVVNHQGSLRLWCNARVSALMFYQKLGFKAIGKPFSIRDIGEHRIMAKVLSA